MKKALSILIIAAMTAQMSIVSFAAEKSNDVQKVLSLIKPRIGSTEKFTNFESSIDDDSESGKRYRFFWSNDSENYSSLSVSCTEDGIITDYYSYNDSQDYYTDKASINKLDRNVALSKAQTLLNELNPQLKDKLFVEDNNQNNNIYGLMHYFNVKRYENGIPVSFNTGHLTINEDGSRIVNFNVNWTQNIDFAKPENVISADKAKELYKEKLGIELMYKDKHSNGRDYNDYVILPCYTEKNSNGRKFINALTGELTEETPFYLFARNTKSSEMAAYKDAGAGGASFTPAEEKELENLSGLLSKEEITANLKKLDYMKLPSDAKLNSSGLYKNQRDEKIYTLYFKKEISKDKFAGYNYTVNAQTGEVLSYNAYNSNDSGNKNLKSKDFAYKTMTDAAKYAAGDKFSEYEEEEFSYPDEKEKTSEYFSNDSSLRFIRKINGVPYDSDKIYINIDLSAGNISSYSIDYTTAEFPSVEKAIGIDAAYDKLFENVKYEPAYILSDKKAELVYKLENKSINIDAFTGTMLDYSLNEAKTGTPVYTDIKGHYAEDKINKLLSFGIGFSGDEFKPDEAIRQKDFIALLTAVFCNREILSDNDYDDIYRDAKRNGFLTDGEISPESSVTRIEAAKFLIRAMKLDRVAELDGIFKTNLKDITDGIGYASILSGMKIINGDENGNFNPNSNLSRADSAIIIYNYLSVN